MRINQPLKPYKSNIIRFIIIIFLSLSTFWSAQALATLQCSDLFSQTSGRLSEKDIFSSLEVFEAQLQTAYTEANSKFGQNQSVNTEMQVSLAKLAELSRDLELLQDKALSESSIHKKELEAIFTELEIIRNDIKNVEQKVADAAVQLRPKSPEEVWKEIEADTSLIQAEVVYDVNIDNGAKLSVLFSDNIVNEVFRGEDKVLFESSLKAIAKVKRGIFGGSYNGPGIKKLIVNSTVLELGAYGKQAGVLRFGGYFHEGVLHFRYWSNTSNSHSSESYINRFRDSVLRAKRQRGH